MAEKEIDVLATEEYEIEMEEVLPPVVTEGGTMNHALLNNREVSNQHPILAITGLSEELADIRALKEIFSNKYGHANYYLWDDGGGEIDERVGYFVSACDGDCSKITMCNRGTVLGVSVDTAAFIGNKVDAVQTKCNVCGNIMEGHWVTCSNPECQSTNVDYIRKKEYGLVATSGVVSVRCENDVIQGDYVMPNANGVAAKVDSQYGYQVIEVDKQLGVPYAAIDLDATTSSVYGLGVEVEEIEGRVAVNEKNIVSAINVANQAYNKSQEAATSSSVSEEAVKEALESILDSEKKIEEFEKVVESTSNTSAQARAIAESAVNEATILKTEAIARANDAWAKADEVQTETYSLCAKIDKHSVGEYSQAYGLTLEQAQSILEIGMIYVPTKHKESKTHTEEYSYVVGEETKTYTRTFVPGYLYEWREIPNSEIGVGWVTVDKNYDEIMTEVDADETNPINTSAMGVYFSNTEIAISDDNKYGYWYTDADTIYDIEGQDGKYDPYTLYHWENNHWVAVATLKGNVSNRMVSEVYQTTNEIMMAVMNPRGGIAGFDAKLTDTEAKIDSIAAWPSDISNKKYNMAILEEKSDENGAYMTLATVRDVEGSEPKLENIGGAKIILADAENGGSFIRMDADKIDFTAGDFTIDANHIVLKGGTTFVTEDETDGTTKIDGGKIATGTITADQISTDALSAIKITADNITSGLIKSENYDYKSGNYSEAGSAFDLDTGYIRSKTFAIDESGDAHFKGDLSAFGAKIGGWSITENGISKGTTSINSSDDITHASLIASDSTSPVRISVGGNAPVTSEKNFTRNVQVGDNTITLSGIYKLFDVTNIRAYAAHSGWEAATYEASYEYKGINEDGVSFNIKWIPPTDDGYNAELYIPKISFTCVRQRYETDVTPRFKVLEDGSLYASNASVNGKINANEGEIADLKIQNGGIEGLVEEESSFVLDSSGLKILGDSGSVQVGSICLKNEDGYSTFSAQGEVRIQSENSEGDSPAYMRFGGVGSGDEGQVETATIILYAKTVGTLLSPKVTFYATSSRAMSVSYAVEFYWNVASWGMNYPQTARKAVLSIPMGGTRSSDYSITYTADIINRWLRFSSDESGVTVAGTPGSLTETETVKELCMATGGTAISDSIVYPSFTWSSSTNNFYINGNIVLDDGKTGNLGSADNRWDAVFAKSISSNESATTLAYTDSGTIDSSDKNIKRDIEELPDSYSELFDSLEPVRYKYIENTSDRYHTGFIAQDVLAATEKAGLTTKDFAAYCEWQEEDGTATCGLRYSELIALCVNEIQQLKKRVVELEDKLNTQQND